MKPHEQSLWHLHEMPAYAHRCRTASAGYPAVAESAVALTQGQRDDLVAESAFIVRRHRLWPTASTGRACACMPERVRHEDIVSCVGG
jgi:hypothetical protein